MQVFLKRLNKESKMKPRRVLIAIIILAAAALALVVFNTFDRNPAEETGVAAPTQTP